MSLIEKFRDAAGEFAGVLQVLIAGSRQPAELAALCNREFNELGDTHGPLTLLKIYSTQAGDFRIRICVGTPPIFATRTPERVRQALAMWELLAGRASAQPWDWLVQQVLARPAEPPVYMEVVSGVPYFPWAVGFMPNAPRWLVRHPNLFEFTALQLERSPALVTPTQPGLLGFAELCQALQIHPSNREAFRKKLERARKKGELEDADWRGIADRATREVVVVYRADSQRIRELAHRYKSPTFR